MVHELYIFLMEPCNPSFLRKIWHMSKTMTDKCWQKDVLTSKFNVESKFEIKIKDGVDFRYFRKCRHSENILFEPGAIFTLIRFWEIRKFLTDMATWISLYIIQSRRSFCPSTSSRSSISGLCTKRLTSTLNDIIYLSDCLINAFLNFLIWFYLPSR
jgi:hypothetical protein